MLVGLWQIFSFYRKEIKGYPLIIDRYRGVLLQVGRLKHVCLAALNHVCSSPHGEPRGHCALSLRQLQAMSDSLIMRNYYINGGVST